MTAPRPSGKAEQDDARRALAELSVPSEPGNERLVMERVALRASNHAALAQHLGDVHKEMRFFGFSTAGTKGDLAQTPSASGTLNLYQDQLYTLARSACGEIPSVRQCQK